MEKQSFPIQWSTETGGLSSSLKPLKHIFKLFLPNFSHFSCLSLSLKFLRVKFSENFSESHSRFPLRLFHLFIKILKQSAEKDTRRMAKLHYNISWVCLTFLILIKILFLSFQRFSWFQHEEEKNQNSRVECVEEGKWIFHSAFGPERTVQCENPFELQHCKQHRIV